MTVDTSLFSIVAFFSLSFEERSIITDLSYLMTAELSLNSLILFSSITDAFSHQLHYTTALTVTFASL